MAGRSWRRDAGLSRGLGPASAVARILFSSSLWPCPPRLTAGRETALGLCHLPLPSAAAQASDEGQGVQVPVCPLCNSPIPVKTGAVPDVVVGEHMDGACKHHPGKKKEKIFTYRCSKEGCRRKEMLRVACAECRGSFCIQHRHPQDHGCTRGGPAASTAGCSAARDSEPGPSGASREGPGGWLARRFRWRVKR
ncbi:AN1-type zinc finger protein 2A isoform X1 [Neophocaena asiaeorientalis asiaeorientalis]|uniref:AN1-type zinc finger protein 2A isoform X1 n=1 Tax=Neophocaena asiaeorientalis asiaeorientalis TaxID=1706337 RepID=A0A341CZE1_NEOAA|nr:AN1-type zinc finger protein 2A isoform X1 [Neophocaena asiaeorientalis asiaeorientalis]